MHAILCFGDSITFGRGESPSVGWVGRLKDDFESKDYYNCVYNLGIPGDKTADLLKRFDAECDARARIRRKGDKFLILIAIGTNDSKMDEKDNPKVREEQFEKNIKELITKAGRYSADVAFIGLTPVDEAKTHPYQETSFTNARVNKFNDIVKDCCEQANLPFFDMFREMSSTEYKVVLNDGLHPNADGYAWMFETIKGFLGNIYDGTHQ